ncbi:MAG: prepilin peptidase [Lachnospiraceae bacterium]|nr:prepilin peptidase [Lachnospiraceae bacterium]
MVYLLIVYLVILSIRDIRRKEFSVGAILGGLGVGLVRGAIKGEWVPVLLGIIPGMLLILMGFLTREKVGYGDGVLLIIVGLIMGWPGSLVVYILAQFGVLFYAILLLVIKHVSRDVQIPFAPFLTVALVVYQMGGMIL